MFSEFSVQKEGLVLKVGANSYMAQEDLDGWEVSCWGHLYLYFQIAWMNV